MNTSTYQDTLAIVGLGLIGGSLALALRDYFTTILALETNPATIDYALQNHIVDDISDDPHSIIPRAQRIILALPVRETINFINQLPYLTHHPVWVMDVCSTKSAVIQALEGLPEHFDVVGGHPMCGKSNNGIWHAETTLFNNTTFFLTQTSKTTNEARAFAEKTVRYLGSKPKWVTASYHDDMVAITSHLPHLIASALVNTTPDDAVPYISTGFLGATRLASSSTNMVMDILMTNRENILKAIDAFKRELSNLEAGLQVSDEEALASRWQESQQRIAKIKNEKGYTQ